MFVDVVGGREGRVLVYLYSRRIMATLGNVASYGAWSGRELFSSVYELDFICCFHNVSRSLSLLKAAGAVSLTQNFQRCFADRHVE